jgi:hypothetical protein
MSTKLIAGQKYDIASLDFTGWSNGEASYGGVRWTEWFTADGEYRGADDEGVEPLFDVPESLYYVAATAASGEGLHADEVLGQYARTYFVDSGDAQAAVEELEEDSDELVGPGITYTVERIRYAERVESRSIVPAERKQLSISEIKSEIESQLSPEAMEWWTNTTNANEFIAIAQRDGIDEAVLEIEACAARPAAYRWDGSALYRYSDESDAYIHCFQSIYVTEMDEAIRLYEARKAAAAE